MQAGPLPFPNLSPELFSISLFGTEFALRWYALAYIVGILIAWGLATRALRRPALWPGGTPPMQPRQVEDLLTWIILGVILGGRLGYVLFYDFAAYLDNPLRIAMLWTGGMSFHGGLAGTIVAMILFARARGFAAFSLFDVIAASIGFGVFLGRITNFINQELWGKPTDLPWGVIFPAAGPEPRHPSQIYEAVLEGLMLFILLRVLTHAFGKLKQPGFVAGAFVAWYACCRILIEFVRLPDTQLGYLFGGWLTMGMVLSLPMLAAGIWAMARAVRRAPIDAKAQDRTTAPNEE